jgi:hypothetical protein
MSTADEQRLFTEACLYGLPVVADRVRDLGTTSSPWQDHAA